MVQNRMQLWAGAMTLFGLSEVMLETLRLLRLVGAVLSVYPDEAAAKHACT
jgi:hypothetical protein